MQKIPPEIEGFTFKETDDTYTAVIRYSQEQGQDGLKVRGGIPDETLAHEVAQAAVFGFKMGYNCYRDMLLERSKPYGG